MYIVDDYNHSWTCVQAMNGCGFLWKKEDAVLFNSSLIPRLDSPGPGMRLIYFSITFVCE